MSKTYHDDVLYDETPKTYRYEFEVHIFRFIKKSNQFNFSLQLHETIKLESLFRISFKTVSVSGERVTQALWPET